MLRTNLYKPGRKYLQLLAVTTILLCAAPAHAGLNLSVTPVSGGNSIRFGRVDLPAATTQEVRIRINSTEATQYQVFQRVSQPFTNERGESLDHDTIRVSVLTGSNSAGSVELQTVEELGYTEQLIYTSTNNGLSDGLTLIYQVDADRITRSGNFSGQILYTVRPIGSGSRVDERILNAYLEVEGELDVRREGGRGSDIVRLYSDNPGFQDDYFRVSFSGNRSGQLRIYQEVVRYPVDDLNTDMGEGTVQLWATGGELGELSVAQPVPLSRQRQLIYEGSAAADEIWMRFRINEEKDPPQTAGTFHGRLQYIVETETATHALPVDLEIVIAPVFEMTTEYPPGGMSFQRLLPTDEPQYKEVLVTVNTNTGQPYLVSQNVRSALTNDAGEEFERDNFTYKQELSKDIRGRVTDPKFVPVPEGEHVMYYSDEFGSPASFRVIYRLRPHSRMRAGDYRTSVRYTLEEK